MIRRQRVEIFRWIERDASERRRFHRKRLRRPRRFAGHVALRHRTLVETEDRLAGDAIEDEEQRHLRHHRDSGNRAAVPFDVDQRGRGGQIEIPEIMMDELLEPFQLARVRIERDDRIAVQIRALAIATVVIRRRCADRRVDDAPLRVDGKERPDVRAGAILPALALPRLHARFARARHGVERPEQLAAPRIPPADVAVQPGARRLLAVVAARDHDALVDNRRRNETEAAVDVAANARLEIDVAAVTERGRHLP